MRVRLMIRVACHCGQRFQLAAQHRGERFNCTHCGDPVLLEGEEVSSHDVFISHSSKDKTTADAVCAALEAGGLRCWMAPRDIPPGSEWGEAIVEGIELCQTFVVVFSGESNQSKHVMREVERAVNRGAYIIPFRIEDITPSKSMEYFLSAQHWLDAMAPPLDAHLEQLVAAVRKLEFGGQAPPRGENDSIPTVHAPQVGKSRMPLWLLGSVALVIVFVAAMVLVFRPSDSPVLKPDDGPDPAASVPGTNSPGAILSRAAERKILAALDETFDAEFNATPLNEVAKQIGDRFGINVQLDDWALAELAMLNNQPISWQRRDLSLRSFLNLMLSQLDLAFVVKNEVVLITSQERRNRGPGEIHPASVVKTSGKRSEQILSKLDQIVSVDLVDRPLVDAFDHLDKEYDVRVFMDQNALDLEAIPADALVNLQVRDITLRSVLQLLCDQLRLTYQVQDEVVYVTVAEVAK